MTSHDTSRLSHRLFPSAARDSSSWPTLYTSDDPAVEEDTVNILPSMEHVRLSPGSNMPRASPLCLAWRPAAIALRSASRSIPGPSSSTLTDLAAKSSATRTVIP